MVASITKERKVEEDMVKKAVRIHYFSNFSTICIHTLLDCKYIYSYQRGTLTVIYFLPMLGMHCICEQ